MTKRQIITIDEEKCNGCGQCIPGCPEGAINLVDGKARLVSDIFCDGLGACLGHCPEGAISVLEREAEAYDEVKVIENVIKQGPETIKEHLLHLKSHGQTEYLQTAISYLQKNNIAVPIEVDDNNNKKEEAVKPMACGCPGTLMKEFNKKAPDILQGADNTQSELTHWPIQGHLISPAAPYFKGADVLLSADCVAYACGGFHNEHLRGKKLVIACPKLDSGLDIYIEKITALIDEAQINTLTVMIMEVPCCRGLMQIAKEAALKAKRKVPIKLIVISTKGDVLSNEWI